MADILEELKLLIKTPRDETISSLQRTFQEENAKLVIKLENVESSVTKLATRLNLVEKEVLELKAKTSGNCNDIKVNTYEKDQHNDAIKGLQSDLEKLSIELDEQTDRNMRETLVIHGVGGAETSWEDTTDVLCNYLSDISKGELSFLLI